MGGGRSHRWASQVLRQFQQRRMARRSGCSYKNRAGPVGAGLSRDDVDTDKITFRFGMQVLPAPIAATPATPGHRFSHYGASLKPGLPFSRSQVFITEITPSGVSSTPGAGK